MVPLEDVRADSVLIPPYLSNGFTECRHREPPLSVFEKDLTITGRLLQVTSLLPHGVPKPADRAHKNVTTVIHMILTVLSLIWILGNTVLFGITSIVSYVYYACYGIWHPMTMQAIVSGLKPLQCLSNLVFMLANCRNQRKLFRMLYSVGAQTRKFAKYCDLGYKRVNKGMLFIALFLTVFLEGLRAANVVVNRAVRRQRGPPPNMSMIVNLTAQTVHAGAAQMHLGAYYFLQTMYYLEKMSYFLLPAFGIWQILPLMYFGSVTYLARSWMHELERQLDRTTSWPKEAVNEVSTLFDRHAALQRRISKTFHWFVLFNLALSVLTLCLTVYFFSQLNQFRDKEFQKKMNWAFYFNNIWSGLQILTLVSYVVVIYVSGYQTNERTSKFFTKLVHVLQHDDANLSKVAGLITTYALVLLRMRNPPAVEQERPRSVGILGLQCF